MPAVDVAGEDRLPLITSAHDMVDRAGILKAKRPSHGRDRAKLSASRLSYSAHTHGVTSFSLAQWRWRRRVVSPAPGRRQIAEIHRLTPSSMPNCPKNE